MAQQPFAHPIVPRAVSARAELITRDGYRLTSDDRLDIMELPALFEWMLASQNFDAIADLYTDDIIIDHALAFAQGKAAAIDLARSNKIPTYGLRHQYRFSKLTATCPKAAKYAATVRYRRKRV